MNADGSNQTRLTNNSTEDIWSSYSPDGSKIAFQSHRDGNAEIYVILPDLQISGKIAFVSASEIYVMNADGTGQTQLTNNSVPQAWPSWSPDGTKIAFSSDDLDGNPNDPEIYVINADGTGQTKLTNNARLDYSPS